MILNNIYDYSDDGLGEESLISTFALRNIRWYKMGAYHWTNKVTTVVDC